MLIGKPFIGADSEWKCQGVNAFDKGGNAGPAILQLSSDTDAFVIDLISLAKCKDLDVILTQIFAHPNTAIVGFAFQGDLEMLKKHLP